MAATKMVCELPSMTTGNFFVSGSNGPARPSWPLSVAFVPSKRQSCTFFPSFRSVTLEAHPIRTPNGVAAVVAMTRCEDVDLCQSCNQAFSDEGPHTNRDHTFTHKNAQGKLTSLSTCSEGSL